MGPARPAMQRAARPDPFNPIQYPDKSDPLFDPAQPWRVGSIAEMPAVPQNPWLERRSGVAAGAMHHDTVTSAFLKMANPRTVWENRPEGNGGTTLLASNRHLRDVLRAKGYTIQYAEVYGDHDPVHWRRTLPEALTVMLGN